MNNIKFGFTKLFTHSLLIVLHDIMCVVLTRQSVGLGPVQPAAQCSLQQSMGLGPLHLPEHCSAHISLVTGQRERKKFRNTKSTMVYYSWQEYSNNRCL